MIINYVINIYKIIIIFFLNNINNVLIFKKWRLALGGNIKYIITGGAACQVKLLRIFTAAKIPVFEGYGPTENCPVISVNCNKKGGTKFDSSLKLYYSYNFFLNAHPNLVHFYQMKNNLKLKFRI